MSIPYFQAAGASSGNSAGFTLAWPTHVADDVGILLLETYDYSSELSLPAGWSAIPTSPLVDTGVAVLHAYWKRAASGAEADVSIPDLGDHAFANIVTYRDAIASGDPWVTPVVGEGNASTVTLPDITVPQYDARVIYVAAHGVDGFSSEFSNWVAGANSSAVTERWDATTNWGNGGGLAIADATSVSEPPAVVGGATVDLATATSTPFFTTVLLGELSMRIPVETATAPPMFERNATFGLATEAATPPPAIAVVRAIRLDAASATHAAPAATWAKHIHPAVETATISAMAPATIKYMDESVTFSADPPIGVVGKLLVDTLTQAAVMSPSGIYQTTLLQDLVSSAAANAGWPVSLANTVNLSALLSGELGVAVFDALSLDSVLSPNTRRILTHSDVLALSDTLLRFLSGVAIDTVNLSAVDTPNWLAYRTAQETENLSDTVAGSLVFRVVSEEGAVMSAADLVQLLWAGGLSEEIEFTIGAVSPTGDFTAWAVNATTSAITEYTNFQFNSFARAGTAYLGASSEGLYRLDGDDDAGTDIIGTVRSGYAQFGGARLASPDVAYLGVRGDGAFVLRIVTADGQTYTYSATTSSMETTRVKLGRGIRARYIAFELESSGQDFDLESVEMLPVVLSRRV